MHNNVKMRQLRRREKYLLKLGEINASFKGNLMKMSENTWIHYTIIQYIFVSIVIQLFYDRLNETFIDACPNAI